MAATSFFGGAFFGGEFFNTASVAATTEEVLGVGNWAGLLTGRKKKPRKKPLRWADYADAEERQAALAKALAEASVPLAALRTIDGDLAADAEEAALIDAEDALISALIMSRMIH